ncbi:FAD-dependent oxidoreductase [Streptomyces sp. HUAS MG91]|uniref:FAD-dependent oxidoreductase n=1 Tax=Streptomyces tabacisoli TaxID=3156398 RepID=A0AAU8J423_9ACTN
MSPVPTSAGILVVGASQAGVQLAATLRERGFDGQVTLLGAENHPPYQRPPLSKKALQEGFTAESLHFRTTSFYEDQAITLALGHRVVRIDRGPDGSGIAWTDTEQGFAFDRLALTVGARPRRLPLPGAELAGVLALRSLDDAAHLGKRLRDAERVVVVGGGFIGLEVAASARLLGRDVAVVLADDRLMARAVGPLTSDLFLAAHRRRDVEVHLASRPTRFIGDGAGAVHAVELDDGQVLAADLVVVGVGAAPRTEVAEAMGLTVDDGVVVDERCLTSDGFTVAAGDCVRCPTPIGARGPAQVRFESVSTAIEQARVAAATLLGGRDTYRAVPWFWSDQGTLKLQVAGLPDGHDRTVVRGSAEEEKFSALYYRGDTLVAAECVNRPADFMAVRAALNAGLTIDASGAADPATPLKTLRREVRSADEGAPA